MVPTNDKPQAPNLAAWEAAVARQAEELRGVISAKQAELAQLDERLIHIRRLMEIEAHGVGAAPDFNGARAPRDHSGAISRPNPDGTRDELESAVEKILREVGKPVHISEIRKALLERGVPIPGRGDDANIIVRLRRLEERFTRTARGTYGLAEWGLPELSTRSPKQRRRRTST